MKKLMTVVLAMLVMITMVVSVYAKVAVAPSIEQKEVEVVDAELKTTDGQVYKIGFEDLIVTNFEQAVTMDGETSGIVIEQHIVDSLLDSMGEIMDAKTMVDLCPELEEVMNKLDPALTAEDWIVAALFDATLEHGFDEILHEDYANNITITFDIGLTDNTEEPIFMYRDEEGEWHVIPEEYVEVNDDNTVTVFFLEICPIAILMTASGMIIENPDIVSPQTGVNWTPYIICGIAVVLALSALVALRMKKRA